MSRTHRLTSIAFSHYVEKARWALDRFGVPYEERGYLPLFHFPAVWSIHRGKGGRSDKASSRLSTPVLQTPEGEVFSDSSDIVRYASERFAPEGHDLYPRPEVAELEQRFGDVLGPHNRRVAYQACFDQAGLLERVAMENVGPLQSGIFRAMGPVAKLGLKKALGITPARAERSIGVSLSEMDFVDDLLSDGRPYLTGDSFTAADLAFACMASLPIMPAEFSAWLPSPGDVPERLQRVREELLQRPSGELVLRLFREERRRVVRD